MVSGYIKEDRRLAVQPVRAKWEKALADIRQQAKAKAAPKPAKKKTIKKGKKG